MADLEKRLTNSTYICGGSQMSIADLSAAHELEQGKMIGLDLSQYPKVSAWYARMIDEDPVSSELVHELRRIAVKTSTWLKS